MEQVRKSLQTALGSATSSPTRPPSCSPPNADQSNRVGLSTSFVITLLYQYFMQVWLSPSNQSSSSSRPEFTARRENQEKAQQSRKPGRRRKQVNYTEDNSDTDNESPSDEWKAGPGEEISEDNDDRQDELEEEEPNKPNKNFWRDRFNQLIESDAETDEDEDIRERRRQVKTNLHEVIEEALAKEPEVDPRVWFADVEDDLVMKEEIIGQRVKAAQSRPSSSSTSQTLGTNLTSTEVENTEVENTEVEMDSDSDAQPSNLTRADTAQSLRIGQLTVEVPANTNLNLTPVKEYEKKGVRGASFSDQMKCQVLGIWMDKGDRPLDRPSHGQGVRSRAVYRKQVTEEGELYQNSSIYLDDGTKVSLKSLCKVATIHEMLSSKGLSIQTAEDTTWEGGPGLVHIMDMVMGELPRTREVLEEKKEEIMQLAWDQISSC